MIVRIADLASGPRRCEFDLEPADIRRAIGDRPDVMGISAGRADVNIEIIHKTVNMAGRVAIKADMACARCASEFEATIRLPVKGVAIEDRGNIGPFSDESEGFSYFGGDEINLAHYALDAVGLLFPAVVLCDPGCKGLCAGCGADLNRETCRCKKMR